MAIIVGLEEKERILKTIENKIKEVKSINEFLSVFSKENNTVVLTCIGIENKKPRITLTGNFDTLTLFIMEQRESLVSEITVLCKANGIALNGKELEILGIKEHPKVSLEACEDQNEEQGIEDTYSNSDYYDTQEEYPKA